MNRALESFTYWDLIKKIVFTWIVQLLLALICFLKSTEAYENFMSFFIFLLLASTSILTICIIKEKDDKLAMMAIILQDIGIALQAMLGVMDNHKTMIIMFIGLMGAVFFVRMMNYFISTDFFKKYGIMLCGLLLLSLLAVMLVFGKMTNGVAAWIAIGNNTIQITEIIKFMCLIFFGTVLACKNISETKKYLYCSIIMVLVVTTMFYIGELGTSLLVILVYLLAVYLFLDQRYTRINLIGLFLCVMLGILLMWLTLHFQHQLEAAGWDFLVKAVNKVSERALLIFNYDSSMENGIGYQLSCARKAMVMGGMLGNHHSIYIPVAQSDFIFIVLLEKMGFLTGIMVIMLFVGMVIQGMNISINQHHTMHFEQILSILFTLEMGLRAFVMIAGTIGLIPITGLAMPLLALGGTATIFTYLAIAYIIFGAELPRKHQRRWSL